MKKVFFGNSGAEANECAIKVARKYGAEKKGEEYSVIVTLNNSFHGRTLSTLSATGQDSFHKLFNPLTPNFVHTPANDINASLIHEAAIGKIAGEQLIKLMTLGLTEQEAEEQIVNGFLK
jgi:acetylornithine/succinyldiaminopimelate/putrescine aminotransferase